LTKIHRKSNGQKVKLELDNRKEQIIKAAIKRFARFGVAKTTMNEIAEDSAISKGNIYYYFTDKNALIAEVINELLNEFDKVLTKRLLKCSSTLESIQNVQNTKTEFFEKYYMLNLFEGIDCSATNESIKNIADIATEYGLKIISGIFEKGVRSGELTIPNVPQTAELYIQTLRGIAMTSQASLTKRIDIDHKLMDSINNKQMELAKIFIKAFSNKNK